MIYYPYYITHTRIKHKIMLKIIFDISSSEAIMQTLYKIWLHGKYEANSFHVSLI